MENIELETIRGDDDGWTFEVLKTTKTKKTKEYGIWREKTGLNGRELLKTGALRCIAPFFILRERKLRKNQIFGWLSQNEPEKLRI